MLLQPHQRPGLVALLHPLLQHPPASPQCCPAQVPVPPRHLLPPQQVRLALPLQ
jgi:hypothetical protein